MASRGCLYRTAKVIKRTSRTFFSRKLLIRRVLVTLAVVVCSTSLETLLQSQNLTHGNYRIQLKVLSQLFVLYESTDCFRTQYSLGNHSCRALIQKALACALRPSLHATQVYRKKNEKGEQFRISTRIFRDRNWSRQTTFQTEHGGLTFVL